MATPILIHIGYSKTASTWLQKQLFNQPDLGFAAPWTLPNAEAVEHFVLSNSYTFDPEAVRHYFSAGIEQCRANQCVPVLSNEILSGAPLHQWDWSHEAATRIYQTFPNAKILLLIREQREMILSLYRQYIKKGGQQTLQKFTSLEEDWPGFRPECRLEALEYHHLIRYYQDLFGSEQVLVWPFEYFKTNLHLSLRTFQAFAQVQKNTHSLQFTKARNVGYRGWTLEFRRRLNFVCQAGFFGPGGPPLSWKVATKLSQGFARLCPSRLHEPIEQKMKQYLDEFVGDRYAESNRQTSGLIGMNLSEMGYATAPPQLPLVGQPELAATA